MAAGGAGLARDGVRDGPGDGGGWRLEGRVGPRAEHHPPHRRRGRDQGRSVRPLEGAEAGHAQKTEFPPTLRTPV